MATIKSIEEKAKRYDEAIKRVEDIEAGKCPKPFMFTEGLFDYIFPELKESEDERIMKALYKMAKVPRKEIYEVEGITKEQALAWLEKKGEKKSIWHTEEEDPKRGSLILLIMQSGTPIVAQIIEPNHTFNHGERWAYIDDLLEKQGEQKPQGKSALEAIKEEKVDNANKVEPKFKVGDWISGYYTNYKVLSVNNDGYLVEDVDGNKINILFENEKFHHLFTIADAKDGDVLCCESGWTCIFKALDNHTNTFSSYSFMDKTGWFCETGSEAHTLEKAFIKAYNGNIFPATKEQRELLFSKMKEAGYEWDARKKELNKVEQKPAWSEEDEAHIMAIDLAVNKCLGKWHCCGEKCPISEHNPWLKCLKDRVQSQSTWKPSDEQIKVLVEVIIFAANHESPHWNDYIFGILKNLTRQLKKLRGE